MKNNKLNGFIQDKTNIYFGKDINAKFITKYNSTNQLVFFINKKWFVFTDDRYYEAMKNRLNDTSISVLNLKSKEDFDLIKHELKEGLKKDNKFYLDSKTLTIEAFESIKRIVNKFEIKTIKYTFSNKFDTIREVKSESEIEDTIIAIRESEAIFDKIETSILKVNKSEIQIAKEINTLIINSIANKPSFDLIVAAGKNSANPHWSPSNYIIKEGDFVTIDLGQIYNNVCSDLTRTYFMGSETTISEKQNEVYEIVRQAKARAIEFAKPGVKVSELDKIARQYITDSGYGKFFIHSLGHGVGYDVHENPNISSYSDEILEEGNIITIEPGIYIPNEFGIRIEDDILITNNGSTNLTKLSDKLYFID